VSAASPGMRVALLVSLGVTVLLAGCLGGRRGTPATPPTGQADSLSDSIAGAGQDSARADSVRRAGADSVPPDSAVRDTTTRDSLARDTTDTLTRGDSAKAVEIPVAPKKPTTKDCLLDFSESPPDSRMISNLLGDGSRTTFIGGGVAARCQGDPQLITADSAEQYESAGMMNLIGNVVFLEPGKIRITAPSAAYFTGEEKLVAYGGVVATDLPSGSTFSGPTIEYLRAGSRRPFSRLYAPQRPSLRLVEKDSAGNARPPINITANQMEDMGDTLLVAWGDVVINREQIVAQGDSASFTKQNEKARLIRNAFVMSRDTAQPFRLVGDSIDLFSKDRVLQRVIALHRAQATSNDVSMRAERVEMRLDSQQVDRAWAFGPGRAYAETATQSLEADSIEIRMPAQVVQEVHAVGRAFAFGLPDSARIAEPERDVLAGDTILASFDTLTTPPDTTPKSVLRRVTANGGASSRYQIPSNRGRAFPPAINYVRGKRIVAEFVDGEMRTVEIDSQAAGVFIEPEPDTTGRDSIAVDSVPRTRADSMRRDSLRLDSLRRDSVRADSIRRTRPDTIGAASSLALGRSRRLAPAELPAPFDPDSWPRPRARIALERPTRHD
jgi:hypothetical protein